MSSENMTTNRSIADRLKAAGLRTLEDVLTLSLPGLMNKTGLSEVQASSVMRAARSHFPVQPQDPVGVWPILGIPALARGAITEIFGISGSGKTQIAFFLAARGPFSSVFWLDTEGTYRSERILQMAENSSRLEQIRVRKIRDDLLESLSLIKSSMLCPNGSLVIVDSITAAIPTSLIKKDKAEFVHSIAKSLKSLNCCVLVTNQVRANFIASSDSAVSPALGKTWSEAVNVRLQVHKTPLSGSSRVLTADKCPDVKFVVEPGGLSIVS